MIVVGEVVEGRELCSLLFAVVVVTFVVVVFFTCSGTLDRFFHHGILLVFVFVVA